VSVGAATALDGFSLNNYGFSNLDHNPSLDLDLGDLLDYNYPSDADRQLLENGLSSSANEFHYEFDHLAHHNDSVFDDLQFGDFINNDDQPAPEIQSSDPFAETTASLQPQLGASA